MSGQSIDKRLFERLVGELNGVVDGPSKEKLASITTFDKLKTTFPLLKGKDHANMMVIAESLAAVFKREQPMTFFGGMSGRKALSSEEDEREKKSLDI